MITFLTIWCALLTCWLAGVTLRQNEVQRQLNHLHIKNLREGLVMQDNQPKPTYPGMDGRLE